ncbi:tyrosine-type recombinase/integrase [Streptomyces sp. ZAF1911]|uniref:tyrosine-type recombinase/integrase n=1 Tax=Streptomyces sp. ZAF1911 TaxID=2944129 RepID=UPI00237A2134|nr:tyrosine-type recombinase/integrase [Streptomyces sp. ZAF1911]MDD9376518.1 tyrosine-type recombinase/integrase [Streptomyces sp. ZAF1911]
MTELVLRASGEVSTDRHDPRTDWPEWAQWLRAHLAGIYGDDHPLTTLACAWVAAKQSVKTREARAKGFVRWEAYVRSTGSDVLQVRRPLAEAYARHLEQTLVTRGKNKGKSLSPATREHLLGIGSGFYIYAMRNDAAERNPFDGVERPAVDHDESPTEGLDPEHTEALLATAKKRTARAYAIVLFLYLLFPRIAEMLGLDVEDIRYVQGHYTVPLTRKGGKKQRVPLPAALLDAILRMLEGRTTGPLFMTRTGRRMGESEVWKLLRSLARVAGIPQADSIKPHAVRHTGITDALDNGAPLQDVQDAAGHKDPRTTQKYNRRRRQLDKHPAHLLARTITLPEEPDEPAEGAPLAGIRIPAQNSGLPVAADT